MNIISKLKSSLLVATLAESYLFGSKPIQGKFCLPINEGTKIAQVDSMEDVMAFGWKQLIHIFNMSPAVKSVMENYNEEWAKLLEPKKRYVAYLHKVSHTHSVQKILKIDLAKQDFLRIAEEAYVAEGANLTKRIVRAAFGREYRFDVWECFMEPYFHSLFFELIGIQNIGVDVFNALLKNMARSFYRYRTVWLQVFLEIFTLDVRECLSFDRFSNKQLMILREVLMNLLKAYNIIYPQEEIVEELIEAENLLIKHNQLACDSAPTEQINKAKSAVRQIRDKLVNEMKQFQNGSQVHTVNLNLEPLQLFPKSKRVKNQKDLNLKFEEAPCLGKLDIFSISFDSEEDWEEFIEEANVEFNSIAYRKGSHESKEIFFNFEGQRTKGLLLTYYSHGKDKQEKITRKIRITLRKEIHG